MSNETDNTETDAAFALAEMHRLRTDLAAERKRLEALECAVQEERERWQEASGLERGGDPGGVTPEGLAKYIQSIDARAEQAERERDEALSRIDAWKDASGLLVGEDPDGVTPAMLAKDLRQREREFDAEKAVRERAEADNAAMLDVIVRVAKEEGECLWCGESGIHREKCPVGLVLKADHPGAALLERHAAQVKKLDEQRAELWRMLDLARDHIRGDADAQVLVTAMDEVLAGDASPLLERLRALEKVMDAVRPFVKACIWPEPWPSELESKTLVDAVNAADALKEKA